ncbi:serine/threonine protein kinase [Actinoplanes sp. SE50]|uniref:Stk1 family PASTA domain-containing Ser/Thr kinase n=1 Tax=unclassified Actinoplanes TaxID=2626549 RepID=UPI00023EC90F|nr:MULTISPECIES: Stk1 family PASTA domain-containing Ser/Thr kinase [unclassified Actinoplanes]AEV82600.1 serine/threonine protein kinase, bacterial [Actinoplanes sp. SE50/110]ATO80996.1 serine/threonine protein kinase [Actinoplanes sp. SE50]SLL98403.1 serine/threonine protein kinase [Actinoplanes sp. SE50/110]
MDTTVADTLIGTTIDGRYRITGRVARGGMATVYRATDERLGRPVALKIIHPSQATNVQFVDRFTDEAKTIARLTHPNVVAVYDQGRHQGLPYLVMEFVQGRTLRDLLAQRRKLTAVEALAILEQMLAAIAAAHRAGLVHRDVKPENVLVAEAPSGGISDLVDAVVKVADFGLARAIEASTVDESGQLMATVAYVAPELVQAGQADARTDVYSAGIVLYEMLTGIVPYDGADPVEVAWQHVDNDVPAPSLLVPGLPRALDELVARATRRHPAERPTDAGRLLTEVQAVRDNLGAINLQTALMSQVPARPLGGDATTIVPAVPAADATAVVPPVPGGHPPAGRQRPSWARLPEQTGNRSAPHGRAAEEPPGEGFFADKRRVRLFSLIAVIAVVVLGSTWWLALGRYSDAPNLVNLPKAAAENAASHAHFGVFYGQPQYDDKVAKDSVVSQNPAPGERTVRGETLTLILSLGPEVHAVPDLTGQEAAAAKGSIEELGLKYKEGKGAYSDTVPEGVVISTDPKTGTELKPGDTVTVVLSRGRAPVTVPNLVGMNINDARSKLQELGLSALERTRQSNEPADQVLAQTPKAGAGVEKNAEITLDVSAGPPQVTLPDLNNQNCNQAKGTLEGQGLQVQVNNLNPLNPNAAVHGQNPGPNTPVAPGSTVQITCY